MKQVIQILLFLLIMSFYGCDKNVEEFSPIQYSSIDIVGDGYYHATLADSSAIIKKIHNYSMQPKGKIEIMARVVVINRYKKNTDDFAELGCYYDLGLSWGPSLNYVDPHNSENAQRATSFGILNMGLVSDNLHSLANVHLVENQVSLNLGQMEVGDWIQIRGQLVNLLYNNNIFGYTSVTNTDWQCEIILVEQILIDKKRGT